MFPQKHGLCLSSVLLACSGVACTVGAPATGSTFDPDATGGSKAPDGKEFTTTRAPVDVEPLRSYQTTASVGDFLEVSFHSRTQTVSYKNRTNGFSASAVPYTVDTAGVVTFDDPNKHLLHAIELPGHSVVVDVDHAGKDKSERALAFGAVTRTFGTSDVKPGAYVQMQFRTRDGGLEVGTVDLGVSGGVVSVDRKGYWPRGAVGAGAYVSSPTDFSFPTSSSPKSFLSVKETADGKSETTFLFPTVEGLAFDLPSGNMLLFPAKDTKAFDPSVAGTYEVLTYEKTWAHGGGDGVPEPGVVGVRRESVVVGADAHVEFVSTAFGGKLSAVADTVLADPGHLAAASTHGLYRTVLEDSGARELFVTFTKTGLVFGWFESGVGDSFEYGYGAGVRTTP